MIYACAEAAYTVERTIRRVKGQPPRETWPMADDAERDRWTAWVETLLGGEKLPRDTQKLAASVAIACAMDLGLKVQMSAPSQHGRIREILALTANYFHMDERCLIGPLRSKGIATARHLAMFIAREAEHSYPSIGAAFGNRDHGTVMAAVRKIQGFIDIGDKDTLRHYAALKTQMGEWLRAA